MVKKKISLIMSDLYVQDQIEALTGIVHKKGNILFAYFMSIIAKLPGGDRAFSFIPGPIAQNSTT